jgi:hypothetical protein
VEQILDKTELPLSGLCAELVTSPVGLLRWRLTSGDLVLGAVEEPLERSPVLGWRRGVASGAGRCGVPYTVAWGSLLGGHGPLRVVLARRRSPLRRSARRLELEPTTLGGAFWIAEAEGEFDQLVVSDGAVVEARDLRAVA